MILYHNHFAVCFDPNLSPACKGLVWAVNYTSGAGYDGFKALTIGFVVLDCKGWVVLACLVIGANDVLVDVYLGFHGVIPFD